MNNNNSGVVADELINSLRFNKDTVGEYIDDIWRESLSPFFHIEPEDNSNNTPPVDTFIDIYSLSDITCISQQFNASRFIRDPKRIAMFDNDCIGLCVWLNGQNDVDNAGSVVSAKNSAFLMDMGKPIVTNATSSQCLCLVLPKPLLAQHGINTSRLAGANLHANDPRLTILMGTLRSTFQALPAIRKEHSGAISNSLGALISGLFTDSRTVAASHAVEKAIHHTVVDFIQKNLSNPNLDINLIANILPYSRSTLYRQFSAEGGIANYIREERLKCCYRAIASVSNKSMSIFAIAQSWGFTNGSHFSRVFKHYFGISPNDVREQVIYEPHSLTSLNNTRDKVQQAISWLSRI